MSEEELLHEEKQETVQSFTVKEIKRLARPDFEANPDQYYPTQTLRDLGYSRHQCPSCQHFFWRHHNSQKTICGDSQCDQSYSFIGKGVGIGKKRKISLAEAWQGFKRSLESAKPQPCTAIDRYPVVARWRTDVDFVAAGIFCFQPYCVTGELEPPANPLICPQFCLRFNDLDNIGITGRHYSGFIMLGIQAFNNALKDGEVFGPADCVRANFRWLTEELEIPPDEITFIEDVWAGGGNLGPSIEYFVGGLELGNMVFMTYKTFPDGHREELQVKVIDVGIGLERVPWLVNGSPTSYLDVFPSALNFLVERTGTPTSNDVWEKFGPLSCRLDVDEAADLEETWQNIAQELKMPVDSVKQAIGPVRDLYVVLDHTRTVMMAVYDGSLPSNVGGACNVRNVLRRVFALLHKPRPELLQTEASSRWTRDGKPASCWWDVLGEEGLLQLFQHHQQDLEPIYGAFPEFKSFSQIVMLEWQRWRNTDEAAKQKLTRLTKKRKGGLLTLDDWVLCVTTHGLPADTVSALTKQEIPGNLWYEVAEREERVVKVQPTVLYDTAHLPATRNLYYEDHRIYRFSASLVQVLPNVSDAGSLSVVVLDESHFYPTSGGQEHDTGTLRFQVEQGEGGGEEGKELEKKLEEWKDELELPRKVVDVAKVGPCVLHFIQPPLPSHFPLDLLQGSKVLCSVDEERRDQLRSHHTATHIVFASAKKVLGPHVWQNGAKKTTKMAHLDITHFTSLKPEQILEIENEANRIVGSSLTISKSFRPKEEAEREHGFVLYQGGVVPGEELRVVQIGGQKKDKNNNNNNNKDKSQEEEEEEEDSAQEITDVEACCGTHCDNTAEVGLIKILRASRISDGIVRLSFVSGVRAREVYNEEQETLTSLAQLWSCPRNEIADKAQQQSLSLRDKFRVVQRQDKQILSLQVKLLAHDPSQELSLFRSASDDPTFYISEVPDLGAELLQTSNKALLYVGDTFYYLFAGREELLEPLVKEQGKDWAQDLSKRLISKAKLKLFEKMQKDGQADGLSSPDDVHIKGSGRVTVRRDVTVKKGKKKTKLQGLLQVSCFGLPPNSQNALVQFFSETAGFAVQE